MNLYIASIKLWFKGFKENTERSITYSFEPNKINVITGALHEDSISMSLKSKSFRKKKSFLSCQDA